MTGMAVSIFRPVKGRVLVRLPYRPSETSWNFALLQDILGSGVNVRYSKVTRSFEIAARHLETLVDGLLNEFGTIKLVTEHYRQQTCVEKCWNANAKTASTCVCGCAGQNHGSHQPFDRLILDGSVSIDGEYLRRSRVLTR
jgi:hypothetical protein